MAKTNLSNYEKLLFTIVENAIYKTTSAIELYCTKYAYNQAFFLAIIAEEELAKLVIIPIAKELDELADLFNNRRSAYFNHGIKQKIFTSFGLQNRTHNGIEKLKQECLYVGADSKLKPNFRKINPKTAYSEIKHTAQLLTSSVYKILQAKTLSDDFKKSVIFLLNLLKGCIEDKLPDLKKDILKEINNIEKKFKRNPSKAQHRLHQEIFTNPYELIEIFKAIYQKDYKNHLRKIKNLSFDEMVQYLGKTLEE